MPTRRSTQRVHTQQVSDLSVSRIWMRLRHWRSHFSHDKPLSKKELEFLHSYLQGSPIADGELLWILAYHKDWTVSEIIAQVHNGIPAQTIRQCLRGFVSQSWDDPKNYNIPFGVNVDPTRECIVVSALAQMPPHLARKLAI